MPSHRAAFVDRDGTLIREVGYLSRIDQIELLPRVAEAILILQSYGLKVVMVTNQSAVARGLLNEQGLDGIHREIGIRLSGEGASLDGIYYCPHHPTEGRDPYRVSCECRKPKPGMVHRACSELGLTAVGSYLVGDQISDIMLADQVGAKGLLIDTARPGAKERSLEGTRTPLPWATVPDFWSAVEEIVQDLQIRFPSEATPVRK